MSVKSQKISVLSQLKQANTPLSLPEISTLIADAVNERTLRRWLVAWVEVGVLKRTGKKRGTRYSYLSDESLLNKSLIDGSLINKKPTPPLFLHFVSKQRRPIILEQIRDLWTHSSTALEGNTLTLGDTHAVLGMGLTVSGKPFNEHQEIVGHAKAIDLLYQSLQTPLTKELIFELHSAIQTKIIHDIFKPIGAWKVEVNGTYAVTSDDEQLYFEYANPVHVNGLMEEVIETINNTDISTINADNVNNAVKHYAKIHMAIAHIHPFFDGNGRLARLISNILLLKAGLPPLVIEKSKRREYIECLADYQIEIGQLTNKTGVWPDEKQLKTFEIFCEESYQVTKDLINKGMV
jgi:fido (protein-threonine AMPylation protein)